MAASKKVERADARRNRARIVEVARVELARQGTGVGMDDLARAAGVGVGTLYRHFPTKEALLTAVLAERIAGAALDAKTAARQPDAGHAFFAFLERMWREGAEKKDLVDALGGAGFDIRGATADASGEFRRALGALLRRARQAGAVRADATLEDVLALLAAAMTAAGRPGTSPARLFSIVCDGLRPPNRITLRP